MNTQQEIPLILGGGGITGICRLAGVLLAMDNEGIVYNSIYGTSAGAVVGSLLAAGHSPVKIANIVNGLSDDDIREKIFAWKLRIPWVNHIFGTKKIRTVLSGLLPQTFEDLPIPLSTWAVNMANGDLVNTMRPEIAGSPADAVLASMAVPCLFAPVSLNDGNEYLDGGLRANVPLMLNVASYEKVYIVIPSDRPTDYHGKENILTVAIRAMNIKQNDEMLDLVDCMKHESNVVVLWPDVPTDKGMLHFDHRLIGACYDWTLAELKRHR